MSSIRIHQDLFNFERKRKGFTTRQWLGIGVAVLLCLGVTALVHWLFGIGYVIAIDFGLVAAAPAIVVSWLPVYGMHFDEFFNRSMELADRGPALSWNGDSLEPMKGETNRAYRKKTKKRGCECAAARFAKPGKQQSA